MILKENANNNYLKLKGATKAKSKLLNLFNWKIAV